MTSPRSFIGVEKVARLTYLLGVEVSLLHFHLDDACLGIGLCFLLLLSLLLLLPPLLADPLVAPATPPKTTTNIRSASTKWAARE